MCVDLDLCLRRNQTWLDCTRMCLDALGFGCVWMPPYVSACLRMLPDASGCVRYWERVNITGCDWTCADVSRCDSTWRDMSVPECVRAKMCLGVRGRAGVCQDVTVYVPMWRLGVSGCLHMSPDVSGCCRMRVGVYVTGSG